MGEDLTAKCSPEDDIEARDTVAVAPEPRDRPIVQSPEAIIACLYESKFLMEFSHALR